MTANENERGSKGWFSQLVLHKGAPMRRTGITLCEARWHAMNLKLFNIAFAIFCVACGFQEVLAQNGLSLHVGGGILENAVPKRVEDGRIVISHKTGIGSFNLEEFPDAEQILILQNFTLTKNQFEQMKQKEQEKLRKIAEQQAAAAKRQDEMATQNSIASSGQGEQDTAKLVHTGIMLTKQGRFTDAFNCFKRAADLGSVVAQYNLGMCYFNGEGIVANKAEAVMWFRRAADQGYSVAQCSLGGCYLDGLGVIADRAEAAKWFRKAAEQGDEIAQRGLNQIQQTSTPVVAVETERLESRNDAETRSRSGKTVEQRDQSDGHQTHHWLFTDEMCKDDHGVPQHGETEFAWFLVNAMNALFDNPFRLLGLLIGAFLMLGVGGALIGSGNPAGKLLGWLIIIGGAAVLAYIYTMMMIVLAFVVAFIIGGFRKNRQG